jgi:hypothetical protein
MFSLFLTVAFFFFYFLALKTLHLFRWARFYATALINMCEMTSCLKTIVHKEDYAEDVECLLKIALDHGIILYGGAIRDMFSGDVVQDLDLCGTNAQLSAFLYYISSKGFFISKQFSDQYEVVTSVRTRLVTLQIMRTAESSVVHIDFNCTHHFASKEIDFDVNALMQRGETLAVNPKLYDFEGYAGLNLSKAFNKVVRSIDAKRCRGKIKPGAHFLFRYFKMLRKGYKVDLDLSELRCYKEHAFEGKCLVCQEAGEHSTEASVSFTCGCESRVHLSCFKTMFRVARTDACVKKQLDLFMKSTNVHPFVAHFDRLMRTKRNPASAAVDADELENAETLDYETLAALDSEPLKMNKCMLCKKKFNEALILHELLYIDFSLA